MRTSRRWLDVGSCHALVAASSGRRRCGNLSSVLDTISDKHESFVELQAHVDGALIYCHTLEKPCAFLQQPLWSGDLDTTPSCSIQGMNAQLVSHSRLKSVVLSLTVGVLTLRLSLSSSSLDAPSVEFPEHLAVQKYRNTASCLRHPTGACETEVLYSRCHVFAACTMLPLALAPNETDSLQIILVRPSCLAS